MLRATPALALTAILSLALGIGASRGRVFTPADDRIPAAHPVVLIAHDLWKRRFGGNPGLVGRELTINARPYTVIGVTRDGFRGSNLLEDIELYVPMMMQASVRPPRSSRCRSCCSSSRGCS